MWVPWLLVRYGVLTDAWPVRLAVASPLARVFEFGLGVVVASALRSGWRCPVGVRGAVLLLGLAIGGLYLWQCHPAWWSFARPTSVMNQVTAPCYALLIAAVASRDLRGGRSWLRSRPMVTFGHWSYAFYLVHATVLYAGCSLFGLHPWGPRALLLLALTLAVSIALSGLLYRWVEHPLERRLRGRLRPAPRHPSAGEVDPLPVR
jgi:peptidoglycan/LPS O-acetylase OafA/YrhL